MSKETIDLEPELENNTFPSDPLIWGKLVGIDKQDCIEHSLSSD